MGFSGCRPAVLEYRQHWEEHRWHGGVGGQAGTSAVQLGQVSSDIDHQACHLPKDDWTILLTEMRCYQPQLRDEGN